MHTKLSLSADVIKPAAVVRINTN